MKKEYDHSQIVEYTNGKLDAAAKADLEAQAAADEGLAEEINFYKELEEVYQVIGEEDLMATIDAATKDLEADHFFEEVGTSIEKKIAPLPSARKEAVVKPLTPRRNLRRVLSLAASFLLIATMGLWWANTNFSNQNLVYQSFDTENVDSFLRGDSSKDSFAEGVVALKNKDFEAAIRFFEAIPPESEAYKEARLYAALVQFESGDMENAKLHAQWVVNNSSILKAKAKWLLVNIFLANNETGATFQQLLQEIAMDEANPYYQKEAKALQTRLNSTWRRFVF